MQIKYIFRNSKRIVQPDRDRITRLFFDQEGNVVRVHVDEYYDDSYDNGIGFIYDENNKVEYIYLLQGL